MATQRGYYREELLRAINNLDMGQTHLARVVIAYEEAHPEVSIPIAQVFDAITEMRAVITKVYESI